MSRESYILKELDTSGNLRKIDTFKCAGSMLVFDNKQFVNLSSNDYLGLTSRLDLQNQFLSELPRDRFLMSNPSSRLMCGNSNDYDNLENAIAQLYNAQTALVVGSGFLLNSSILRAVTTKQSVILADKLVHASLTDGLQLADCLFERFRHNDTKHLERLLEKHNDRHIVVAIESLYSMDGDHAPFDEIARLKQLYNFELLVDEAHAFGVYGERGEGLAPKMLEIEYRIATLGKACASTGAFVVCNKERRELMVNKMRSVIFSTALPPINLAWSKFIIDKLPMFNAERSHLQSLIKLMKGQSQIIPIEAGSNERAMEITKSLRDNGFWATAIRHPTVPLGTERVRMSLTAAHTTQQINDLCKLIGL